MITDPPAASRNQWLAVTTMANKVRAGYNTASVRVVRWAAKRQKTMPHQTAQPKCKLGMAAY